MTRSHLRTCLTGVLLMVVGCSQQQWQAADPYGLMEAAYRQPFPVIDLDQPVASKTSDRAASLKARLARRRQARAAAVKTAKRHPWQATGKRTWTYIVIHHSAAEKGNARQFDLAHRKRGWDEMGYHFVITNGHGGSDGAVEVGSRWRKQKWGAHCGGTLNNEYNEHGIGICLVGDFSTALPSSTQRASLQKLVAYLARAYDIPLANIITHRDAPNAKTNCPGGRFHQYVHGPMKRVMAPDLADARRPPRQGVLATQR
ncbi:hypothetical protein LCGC14_0321400 [marine sediment metagenome]|uniref:N-acetylmuramoyl-L-alanine amidase n=1 Tax=marine sediment metagenome TaxID=412755 RepID=A0A0F9WRD7_9ZZZZ|nr:N-acetylmuramoyl-L-alanine amidase [Phycisphaerae bacterium]HDZ44627.1 N-acetylmuramoyl-L-alanine amidase [Phycisphaerae bacterium]